ncbi:MAG: PEP-CTERM sorting domain-containing protein [Phycisphaerae bacterium]|nr:PEP-CTERM sorting domain-containing protein [Phycisphaerae bacterium]
MAKLMDVRRAAREPSCMVTLCLAVILAAAGGSNAGILVNQTAIYDVFVTDPVPVGTGAENLFSTTLYVVNTTGEAGNDPAGFDGVFFGYSGVAGSLHQHDNPGLGVYTPTSDSSLFATAIDTHFLNELAELMPVAAPFETRALLPSAEPSDSPPLLGPDAETTFGDRLSGTFALIGGSAGDTWMLAQLVAPGGTTLSFDFAISGALEPGVEGDILATFVIPEPATLSLLGASGLALLRRRCK